MLSPARKVFAPALGFTVVALLLIALFVRLGTWQWHRGQERQAAASRFAQGADRVLELGTGDGSDLPLYQRVRVQGELDGAHQFLLDNRSFEGQPGYEVLTPLIRAGAPGLIVDRGWVPFTGSRSHLPDVTLAAGGQLELTGRLAALPSPGLALGRAPPSAGAWPKLTSYPDMSQLTVALGVPLGARMLLLDPASPLGYARAWQPPGLPPLRHFAYAVQWWSFAVLTAIMWAVMSRRPPPVAS
ncbi:MAG: SURF1 family protein [Gammaproteobacteria bacterium]|nr:SURF1 family protein [Gammaproteobacteria bacterium]MBV8308651.1 SURF1 family protein [Gammaproteobacteria bacterium]